LFNPLHLQFINQVFLKIHITFLTSISLLKFELSYYLPFLYDQYKEKIHLVQLVFSKDILQILQLIINSVCINL
jgi:hypothetical protein